MIKLYDPRAERQTTALANTGMLDGEEKYSNVQINLVAVFAEFPIESYTSKERSRENPSIVLSIKIVTLRRNTGPSANL